ncbi:MAG TPA: hypothetical protein VJ772_01010 [Nitrososphaeraceae archaeon]|nr:hypothetical protein [Nitrososphaeraceae archaeon]
MKLENLKILLLSSLLLLMFISVINVPYLYADSSDGSSDDDSGDDDSGDNDSGDDDSGDNDSGDNDSGDNDSGDDDSGDDDSGDNDSGDNDSGDNDSGDNDSGDNDSGDNDSGDESILKDTTETDTTETDTTETDTTETDTTETDTTETDLTETDTTETDLTETDTTETDTTETDTTETDTTETDTTETDTTETDLTETDTPTASASSLLPTMSPLSIMDPIQITSSHSVINELSPMLLPGQTLIPTNTLMMIQECDPNTDPSCLSQQVIEEECNDGQDNDGDTLPDKSDPDCIEDCEDGIDNDDDGLDDITDDDCGGSGAGGNPGLPPTDGENSDSSDGDNDDSSGSGSSDNDDNEEGDDFTAIIGIASAENSPVIMSAKEVYETGHLDLDSDIKRLIILIPSTSNDNETIQMTANGNIPSEITIAEDTLVSWMNSDPNGSHNLMIEEKDTGRQMYSDINIEYGKISEFNFEKVGIYSYSYSGLPSASGLIKVVDKTDIDDNSLTSSSNPVVGIGLISSDQENSIQDRIRQEGYALSSFNVDDSSEQNSQIDSVDNFSYVMLVWAAKLFE